MISFLKGKMMGKYVMLVLMSCMMIGSMSGCGVAQRAEYLGNELRSDDKYAEELFQFITEALEREDKEALKSIFSSYTLENSDNLDEQMDKLMEFYPGYDGGYDVSIHTHGSSSYGGKEYILCPQYCITNDGFEYRIWLIAYIENENESEKIGLYSIQVMTEEAKPEGFKWRTEDDAPGIYVLE